MTPQLAFGSIRDNIGFNDASLDVEAQGTVHATIATLAERNADAGRERGCFGWQKRGKSWIKRASCGR